MLERLHIKNIAVIDEAEIEFNNGFKYWSVFSSRSCPNAKFNTSAQCSSSSAQMLEKCKEIRSNYVCIKTWSSNWSKWY